jgi:hypothetical protein
MRGGHRRYPGRAQRSGGPPRRSLASRIVARLGGVVDGVHQARMVVPLGVFFALQRYFVQGVLAGSVT